MPANRIRQVYVLIEFVIDVLHCNGMFAIQIKVAALT